MSHMADRHDIATVIQSALTEIGVAGHLDVEMDGKTIHATVEGEPVGALDVTVHIQAASLAS
jgi:hypothetical protein